MPTKRVASNPTLEPYWQTRDAETVRLYHGHSPEVLSHLPSASVHMAVTSPPYWALRDYRTGSADELGAEDTPEEYVGRLVATFRELRRVLRDDGTFWLNLGDTYGGGGGGGTVFSNGRTDGREARESDERKMLLARECLKTWGGSTNLAAGNLVGIPWRVALAMQADGWILRQEIIWSKSDCMPESVTNRCSRAHEHIFLFSKAREYFYDQYAIREKAASPPHAPGNKKLDASRGEIRSGRVHEVWGDGWRNKRDVWTVSHGQGYGGNHFAVYPPELITPCILAGTSAHGCCPGCGAPWRRILEKVRVPTRPGVDTKVRVDGHRLNGEVTGNRDPERHVTEVRVLGWYPTCGCDGLSELKPAPPTSKGWNAVTPKAKANAPLSARGNAGARSQGRDGDADWTPEYQSQYAEWVAGVRQECSRAAQVRPPEELVPAVVLDPFIGSGTTALVCIEHARCCWGIDLSEQHLQNDAIARISGDLGGRPALRHLVPGKK